MEISALTLKLIILLIPGILSATIYRKLTIRHKPKSDYMFTLISILLGMFSYLGLQLFFFFKTCTHNIFSSLKQSYEVLDTFQNISNSGIIPYEEVAWASIIGIFIAGILVKFDTEKLLSRWASKWKISYKYGDENLFSYYLSSPGIHWVYVRDIDKGLTYFGCVRSFSETTEFKELVLEEVTVYNYPDSEELYEVASTYLCLPKDKIIIEQALIKTENE